MPPIFLVCCGVAIGFLLGLLFAAWVGLENGDIRH